MFTLRSDAAVGLIITTYKFGNEATITKPT